MEGKVAFSALLLLVSSKGPAQVWIAMSGTPQISLPLVKTHPRAVFFSPGIRGMLGRWGLLAAGIVACSFPEPCVSFSPTAISGLPLESALLGSTSACPRPPSARTMRREGGAAGLRASGSGHEDLHSRRSLLKIVAGGALAAAVAPGKAATAAGYDPFGEPVLVLPTEKKLPPPQNPYEQLEPFGESFRGKKGPNLQLPDELSVDDAAPDALLRKEARRSEALNLKVDYFENLSLTGIVGSILWGSALYFGVWFDINIKTNAIQIASGDEGDVRPSDWLKLKLGNVMGMEQDTWDDDWKPPASIQAFTMGVFASMGTVVDRVIEVGLGDSFALMSAMTASIWAGVYELGRTQQKGYRLTREEQDEMDLLAVDFQEFAEERLIVKPTARMHISEFNKAFRAQYGRYRTQDAMSDVKIEGLFKSYARKVTGMKGKAGFYKGVGISASMNAFGGSTATYRREQEAQKFRVEAKGEAEAAAKKSMALAGEQGGGSGGFNGDEEEESKPDLNKMKAGQAKNVGDGQDEW